MKNKNLFIIIPMIVCATYITGCKKKDTATPASTIPPTTTTHTIGESFGGGIVFYVDATGTHGLIVATADASAAQAWSTTSTLINASDTTQGAGQANTTAIVTALGSNTSSAAGICDLSTAGGQTDWYLPSKHELHLLYLQTVAGKVTGMVTNFYWSSSEFDANYAWLENFYNGQQHQNNPKTNAFHVRAIRSF